MSTDFDAIGTALAARFAPAQVTPPTGLQNIRRSSIDLPNTLAGLPVVLVWPDQGELAPGQGSRLSTVDYIVRLYFSVTANLPRETNQCRQWLGRLIDQVRVGESLGGPPVAVARVVRWRIGILPYGRRDYTGIELGVRCTLTEAWAA